VKSGTSVFFTNSDNHIVILQVMVLGSIDLLIPLEAIKHHIWFGHYVVVILVEWIPEGWTLKELQANLGFTSKKCESLTQQDGS
jgi:hypothetical protein